MAKKEKTSAAKKPVKAPAAARMVDAYVERRNGGLKPVVDGLRRLLKKTVPKSREAINPWGIPMFDFHGPLCLIMVGKNYVTLGFPRGTALTDRTGLLEGTGKNLRHVKVMRVEQLRDANLRQLVLEAAALNRKTPLTPSMRVRKATWN